MEKLAKWTIAEIQIIKDTASPSPNGKKKSHFDLTTVTGEGKLGVLALEGKEGELTCHDRRRKGDPRSHSSW